MSGLWSSLGSSRAGLSPWGVTHPATQTLCDPAWSSWGSHQCPFSPTLHPAPTPGYGDSPPTGTVATQQGRVAFLERILEELGLERPVLVSPSMSGRFALPFLLLHGDRLGGFVPIAPVGTRDYAVGQYQRVQVRSWRMEDAEDGGRELCPQLGGRWAGPRGLRRWVGVGISLPDVPNLSPLLQTPTLILYGDRDTHLGPQALQSLRHLPRHRVAVLPGAGHACYLDKPGDFHRALLGFLGQLQ